MISVQRLPRDLRGETRPQFSTTPPINLYDTIAHHILLRGVSEQPAEGDDGGETGEVQVEEGSHALDVQHVFDIAQVERRLTLDVLNQTAEQPDENRRKREGDVANYVGCESI